ncbi:MAG: PRC-barrel domain-containing protein, partial [Lysobacterales bacterium]
MLRSINEITGYTLLAQDGEIGRCQDFLFDDRNWVVRYMVAKTAKWLPGRKVIISPVFLDKPDWSNRQFPILLSQEQIRRSPPLEEHAPVSRQYEINYHRYYSLPFYWLGRELWGTFPDPSG